MHDKMACQHFPPAKKFGKIGNAPPSEGQELILQIENCCPSRILGTLDVTLVLKLQRKRRHYSPKCVTLGKIEN